MFKHFFNSRSGKKRKSNEKLKASISSGHSPADHHDDRSGSDAKQITERAVRLVESSRDLSTEQILSSLTALPTDLQQMVVAVFSLQESRDSAEICAAMDDILLSVQKYIAECVELLWQINIHQLIQNVMQKMKDSAAVQQKSGQILSELMLECNFKKEIQHSNLYKLVLENLDHFSESLAVQEEMIHLVYFLAQSDLSRRQFVHEGTAFRLILNAANRFQEEPLIITRALRVLTLLHTPDTENEEPVAGIGQYKGLLQSVMSGHATCAEVIIEACRFVCLIAQKRSNIKEMNSWSIHDSILHLMVLHSGERQILIETLKSLDALIVEEKVKDYLNKEGLSALLHSHINSHPNSPELIAVALSLFSHLGAGALKDSDMYDGLNWLEQVYALLSEHRELPLVQESGLRALASLLQHCPYLHHHIGDDLQQNHFPVHTLCLGSMLMHSHNATVFLAACNATYWIAADNYHIQSTLVRKNGYLAILEGMRHHQGNASVQECSCRVIRGLCIFSMNNKNKLTQSGIFDYLIKALTTFPAKVKVQVEAIGAIACMADTGAIRELCITEDVHVCILQAMQKFPEVALLQEIALEALTVIAGAEDGATLMLQAEALDRVLHIMRAFTNNAVIQKKSLMLLQLLSDGEWTFIPGYYAEWPTATDEDTLCTELAQAVVCVLQRHLVNNSVVAEGCVAMQILAENWTLMSRTLVKACAHELLFKILETPKYSTGVQELASECLFVLSCVRNLKSEMLLYACANGMLKGVECLIELGADVNVGEGLDTPLCHACNNADTDMVTCLLQQGVTDVQTAISLSLEKNHHDIIGVLLQHIGHDREAGIVSWSGLNLRDVHPEWFLPTFIGIKPKARPFSGKQIASRVKNSEDKRIKRHSSVASLPATLTPKPSLYSRNSKSLSSMYKDKAITNSLHYQSQRRSSISRRNKSIRNSLSDLRSFFATGLANRKQQFMFPEESDARNRQLYEKRMWRSYSLSSQPDETADETGNSTRNSDSDAQWNEDREDWREMTLTGCDVPFSLNDPRRYVNRGQFSQPEMLPGTWKRKSPHQYVNDKDKQLQAKAETDGDWTEDTKTGSALTKPTDSENKRTKESALIKSGSMKTDQQDEPIALKKQLPHLSSSKWHGSATSLGTDDDSAFQPGNVCSFTTDNSGTESAFEGGRSRGASVFSSSEVTKHRERSVTHLDLSATAISSLSSLVKCPQQLLDKFGRLQHLNLSQNQLTDFPQPLCQHFHNTTHLYLNQNSLHEFPSHLLYCPNLVCLDLSENQIGGDWSHMRESSSSVRELNLSHNALAQFPVLLGQLMPGLQQLSLAGNKMNILPTEELHLTSLTELNISHNYIRSIPDDFLKQLINLQSLSASNNELEELPSHELAELCGSLVTLNLDHNLLNEKKPFFIPRFILHLPSLKSLNISKNVGLKGLPSPTLWNSRSLRKLIASHNEISKLNLKDAGKQWPALERLNLSHNNLSRIPKEVGSLTSLASLDVSHNDQLSTLPDEMGRLSKLWEFPLNGLRLDLSVPYTRGRTKDLIGYLQERLKQSVEFRHLKLMVVGFGGRGKSTLVRALMKVRQPEKSVPTVGVLVRDWRFNTSGWRLGKSVTYTLSMWDFAGQEEFYSTHQCFLSNRSLYMVVYNLSKGESEIEKLRPWLLNIHARAPNCPVIVVGTHKDQLSKDNVEETIQRMREKISEMGRRQGFPEIRGMTEVTCVRENFSLEKLRVLIIDALEGYKIKDQAVMEQKIPASYVQLQELLFEEKQSLRNSLPIIRHHRLQKIVQDAQIQLDEDELQQAVRFLHESGYLLHYEDASLQLKDLYFIDPEWLCRMMAQVVTVREINPFITEGILFKSSVKFLFTGKRIGDEVSYTFPSSLIPQYLRLLEKFEIALPLDEEQLLLPCRLPDKKPVFEIPRSKNYGYLRRVYKMLDIPIGMMSRLICRLLVFTKSMLKGVDVDADHISEKKLWKNGIYVCWSKDAFFLVEASQRDLDCLDIIVPGSSYGSGMLGHVVDHIESLIDEWYPGLTEIDTTGECLTNKYAACIHCPENNQYLFPLDKLINESEVENMVICPNHKSRVPIQSLAPDITLGDIEKRFQIDQNKFKFVQSPEHMLGIGGYGSVYRATYNNQTVAVKVYSQSGMTHPHKLMRQEVCVLRQLSHPSLVGLVGIGLHPRVLLLELAPCGSLSARLKSGVSLSKGYQHKIAVQVADGLRYLHSLKIIYRDMKPDNVLLYSLSQSSMITAKISDYGISRFVTPSGLSLCEGTPGYRAPEIARGEPYSFSADVYSFGITLYELVTCGKHPFDHLNFRSELDEAIIKGLPIDPISKKSAPPWPDVEDLIGSCLQQIPESRLEADVVYQVLCSAELSCLRRVIPVSKQSAVECMDIRYHGKNEVEVWMGSGDGACIQLTWLTLKKHSHHVQGLIFPYDRILCILAVGQSSVLIGSQSGKICVYDAWKHSLLHCVNQKMPDSVLCLLHYHGVGESDFILAGLANGRIAIFDTSSITLNAEAECRTVILGGETDSVKCLHQHLNRVYVGCGTSIFILKMESRIKVETSWTTAVNSSGCVNSLAVHKLVYVAKLGSAVVEMWNPKKQKMRHRIDIAAYLKEKVSLNHTWDARVTSLLIPQHNALWVGTGSGHIVLVDTQSHVPVTHISRHTSTIRCLAVVKHQGMPCNVLSAGMGFHSLDKISLAAEKHDGVIAVWQADFLDHYKSLQEDIKRRKEWINKISK